MVLAIVAGCLPICGQEGPKADPNPLAQTAEPASPATPHANPGTPTDPDGTPPVNDDSTRPDGFPASGIKPNAPAPVKPAPIDPVFQPQPSSTKFNWQAALLQSFEYTMFDHLWRAAFDPSLRYQLAHKPFFHDWFASYGGYNLHRWQDGDDFIVNDVGHPLQGAVYSRIFLQNDPRSFVAIGKNRNYWIPLLQSTAWSAIWEVQWKVGPFSETSFGNAGGWLYVNQCGTDKYCLNNPKYPSPPTNNTGLTDWVLTPLIGMAWVMAEDTLEKYVVSPVARNHRILGGRLLRACLEPSRDFAAFFAGKFVWQLPQAEHNFVVNTKPPKVKSQQEAEFELDRWEIAGQYTNISLPVLKEGCTGVCRQNTSGVGFNFDYNLTRSFAFDSTMNLLPGQQGGTGMMEGLFGVKMGPRFEHWGIFAKVRPGFIYYENALPGKSVYQPESLTRFAADFGGVVEVYPSPKSTVRFDVGTTLVRYLTDRQDPRVSAIGSRLSTQYIVTQSNFQVSTGYAFRF
jgi:hypothetical protein